MNNCFLISLLLLISCSTGKSPDTGAKNAEVQLLKFGSEPFNPDQMIEKVTYVPLQVTDPNSIFSEISKVKFINDKIYIMDAVTQHYLYVFDSSGHFIRKVGKQGKGPGEYLRLRDFDVDKEGNIYLYDLQQKRLLISDSTGSKFRQIVTPFRADGFVKLENGGFMFSLMKESQDSEFTNIKLIITDSALFVNQKLFQYSDEFLDNKLTYGLLSKYSQGILYNKPVNDSIFLISESGTVEKIFVLDFENSIVPNEIKDNYAKLTELRSSNTYKYLYNPPLIVNNYIIGNIFWGPDKAFFAYDTESSSVRIKKVTIGDYDTKYINFPIGVVDDSVVVSYLDYNILQIIDKNSIPIEIRNHIENMDGIVLVYHFMKN